MLTLSQRQTDVDELSGINIYRVGNIVLNTNMVKVLEYLPFFILSLYLHLKTTSHRHGHIQALEKSKILRVTILKWEPFLF